MAGTPAPRDPQSHYAVNVIWLSASVLVFSGVLWLLHRPPDGLLLTCLAASILAIVLALTDAVRFLWPVIMTHLRRPGWEWTCVFSGLACTWAALSVWLEVLGSSR